MRTTLPDRRRLTLYVGLVLLLDVLFVVVYGGSNWITAQRDDRWRLYFDWELAIPFVPWMIHVYLSITWLFLLPLFLLDEQGLLLLARRIALAIVLSGAVFLALPAELGFERPERVPGYDALYATLYVLDRPHNLVPSLHISYSALIIVSLVAGTGRRTLWIFFIWLALICVAVVLVHQHHVVDVLGGFGVTYACTRLVPSRSEEVP
ncbi:MAG: phosphatase PAP2 family protein [Planctomycetota bacterium]